jgi:hypothetical protein
VKIQNEVVMDGANGANECGSSKRGEPPHLTTLALSKGMRTNPHVQKRTSMASQTDWALAGTRSRPAFF